MFKIKVLILIVTFLLLNVPLLNLARSENFNKQDNGPYMVVNKSPQLSAAKGRFSIYMALWRSLSKEERQEIVNSEGGYILSNRKIKWKASACSNSELTITDSESFWYYDPVKLDANNKLIPSPYAKLSDNLYFVALNFNSQPVTKTLSQEGASLGEVLVELDYRLFTDTASLSIEDNFFNYSQYYVSGSELSKIMNKFNPMNWPVFHDERAHKPHSLAQPAQWKDTKNLIQKDKFTFLFTWNTCNSNPEFNMYVERAKLPKPGPTRPGRNDKGNADIDIRFIAD